MKYSAWWARQDLNPEPDGYEPSALTIELQAPTTEHVAAKLYDFADNNMLQTTSLARILLARAIPPWRKARRRSGYINSRGYAIGQIMLTQILTPQAAVDQLIDLHAKATASLKSCL